MILEDMKLLKRSKLSGVALKHDLSTASLISRSLSSCSTDDFLPTFESEDDDWRKFGWLLELNDIKLPCFDEEDKVLKPNDSTYAKHHSSTNLQRSQSAKKEEDMEKENSGECVDPSEFIVNRHEAASQYAVSPRSLPTSEGHRSPRAAESPMPALFINDGMPPEGARVDEQQSCSVCEHRVDEQPMEQGQEDRKTEEPIAKRTRNSVSRRESLDSESERRVRFIVGDDDEQLHQDEAELGADRGRLDSVDYGLPTMCSPRAPSPTDHLSDSPAYQSDSEEAPSESSSSESDQEPVAKRTRRCEEDREPVASRTRHARPAISLDDGQTIAVPDWQPLLSTAERPHEACRNTRSRKRKYTKRLYCMCQLPYNRREFYVGCDGCNGWFHPACIGITEKEAVEAESFFCPNCVRAHMELEDS